MLKKRYRLLVFRTKSKAKKIDAGPFVLKISKNNKAYSRFGFTVSKAYDKKAVVRNKIKRQVRAVIEEMFAKILTGMDILFVVKRSAKDLDKKKLKDIMLKTLEKEKLING